MARPSSGLKSLFNSAKILRMKIPFTMDEVMEAQKAVVRENKLESCYLRPLTWIGSQKLGVSPKGNTIHLMVAAWAWGAYLGEEGMRRGILYTPDLSAGALNGITRNTVLHICKDLGLELVQKRITRDEVYIADEAFFTGTAAEVTPIRELDRVELGSGSRGPITEKIQSAFFDIVNGRNPKYAHWLSKV